MAGSKIFFLQHVFLELRWKPLIFLFLANASIAKWSTNNLFASFIRFFPPSRNTSKIFFFFFVNSRLFIRLWLKVKKFERSKRFALSKTQKIRRNYYVPEAARIFLNFHMNLNLNFYWATLTHEKRLTFCAIDDDDFTLLDFPRWNTTWENLRFFLFFFFK